MAVAAPSFVTRERIVHAVGRTIECHSSTGVHCSVWYGSQELQDHPPTLTQHGTGFNLIIHHPFLQAWDGTDEDSHDVRLFQTNLKSLGQQSVVAPPLGDQPEDEAVPNLRLHMHPVVQTFEWFDSRFCLPQFDLSASLEGVVSRHPSSLEWIARQWYAFEGPIDELWIYYDGACPQEEAAEHIGFAAADFVRIGWEWQFAGALSGRSARTGHGSYEAELNASLLAAKFLYDLTKVIACQFGSAFSAAFLCDSLTVGHQAEGLWTAKCDTSKCHLIRSILQLCEGQFAVDVSHHHVKGHCGDPGNELVDVLAGCAAKGQPLQDWDHFLTFTADRSFRSNFAWARTLFTNQLGNAWDGHTLLFPTKPSTVPAHTCAQVSESTLSQADVVQFNWTLLTCNVLTLKPARRGHSGGEEETGLAGPARLQSVLAQFQQEGILLFGLQETRIRRIARYAHPDFVLVNSAANDKGQYGIIAGFLKKLPCRRLSRAGHDTDLFFTDDMISIVYADPRTLILRVKGPACKFVVVIAHAPHTGADLETIKDYWQQIHSVLSPKFDTWKLFLLADANCRLGSHCNHSVGDYEPEVETPKSHPFHDFITERKLFLPSTFSKGHEGPSQTWQHVNGEWKRNDYIGLPLDISFQRCTSWVSDNIDLALLKEDHRPCVCRIAWHESDTVIDNKRLSTAAKFRLDSSRLADFAWNCQFGVQVDVHSHLSQIQELLGKSAQPHSVVSGRGPRKTTMQSDTWELVCVKREWRHNLAELTRLQQKTLLNTIFLSWRAANDSTTISAMDRLLSDLDRQIAVAYGQFRRLQAEAVRMLRRDDVAFFDQLAQESANWLEPQHSKYFWRILRGNLPKFRDRKLGYDPLKLVPLEDDWMPYFQKLEVGEPCDLPTLLQSCHALQLKCPVAQWDFQADLAINKSFLALWQCNFLGGLRFNFSSGVLFLDLANAFHRLVREWVTGIHVPSDLQTILSALADEGFHEGVSLQDFEWPSVLDQLGAPAFLVQLMKDIHSHTWMSIDKVNFAVMRRGTRPGSPLADCVFHLLMSDMMTDFNQWVAAQTDYQDILTEMGISIDSVMGRRHCCTMGHQGSD
eukprot:s750_g30.t1